MNRDTDWLWTERPILPHSVRRRRARARLVWALTVLALLTGAGLAAVTTWPNSPTTMKEAP